MNIDKQALRISELEELNELLREKVKKLESDLWDKEQLRQVYSEKSFDLECKVRELEARNQKDFVWRGKEINRLDDEVDELKEKLVAAEMQIVNLKQNCENDTRIHEIVDLKESVAELAAENAGLKAFKTAVYQQMGAGCEAPEFSITEGLSNLRRFADTLHAIEREFFTKEVPDEECKGETVEECPLAWGMSVEQYVAEFRKCLAEVRESARNEGINYAASRLAAAFNHGFIDKPVAEVLDVTRMILSAKEDLANDSLPAADGLFGEYAEKAIEEWAAQIRKGVQS